MGIRGEEEVICDFNKGGFCAVLGSETGLKWFIELVGVKVQFQLGSDDAFQDFR